MSVAALLAPFADAVGTPVAAEDGVVVLLLGIW